MKRNLIFLCLVFVVLSFSGCVKSPGEATPHTTFEEFNPEITPGGTIEGYMLRPDTLNPILTGIETNRKMLYFCYDSLFYTDSEYNALPLLAKDFDYSSGGRKLTINLREDVLWHDSDPFTASDVKYTLDNIFKNELSPYHALISGLISSVKIGDSYTIILNLANANSGAHNLLTFPIIKDGSMKSEEYSPIGTGAFIFNEIENEENFILTKNDAWAMGHTYVDSININVLPDKDAILSAFNSGMIDFIHISKEDAGKFAVSENISYSPVYTESYCFMGINCGNQQLCDPYVRRLINACIDKNVLAESVLTNYAVATELPVHPDTYFYAPQEKENPEDLIKNSMAFKSEQGQLVYTSDKKYDMAFTLLVNRENPTRLLVAEAIKKALGGYGIKIHIEETDFDDYIARVENGEFDLYIGNTKLSKDNNLSSLLKEGGLLNHGRYQDSKVEALLEKTLKEDNPAARNEKLKALTESFFETMPHIPLYFENEMIVFNADKIDNASSVGTDNIAAFAIRCSVKK